MSKISPFLDDLDRLKLFYGSICDNEIKLVKDIIAKLLDKKLIFKQPIDENYHHLLDFSNINSDECQFSLFKEICKKINGELYWFVFGDNNNPYLFNEFEPPMITKTTCHFDILEKVSSSFMQMQNGAFVVFDEHKEFYAIIVDGYYMVCLLNKSIAIDNLQNYLDNWHKIDKNLDEVTANLLMS